MQKGLERIKKQKKKINPKDVNNKDNSINK